MTITARPSPRPPMKVTIGGAVVAVALLLLGVLIGYVAHSSGGADGSGQVVRGYAYVGPPGVGMRVNGYSYGFDTSPNSDIEWISARGVHHDGGIAPCLRQHGDHVPLTLGWSPASDGTVSWRAVTWVRCGD